MNFTSLEYAGKPWFVIYYHHEQQHGVGVNLWDISDNNTTYFRVLIRRKEPQPGKVCSLFKATPLYSVRSKPSQNLLLVFHIMFITG